MDDFDKQSDDGLELRPLALDDSFDDEEDVGRRKSYPSTQGAAHGALRRPGTASQKQVAVNIFISFVGAGILGMPYAFSRSGWLLGSLALAAVSAANVYSMLLLVKTRKKLEAEGHEGIHGYGDLGRVIAGPTGEKVVNISLVVSQTGFATAYIIFIAANLNSIAHVDRAVVCFGCVPILALLVQARDMKTLSPFSLLADVANLIGLSAVLLQDFENYSHEAVSASAVSGLPYVLAISIYSLEGVGLILPLESSCADRKWFPGLLKKVMLGITVLMAVFGSCGYIAYGNETETPVTLNLTGEWATFVKLALCLALYLTYPIMLFPVNEVMENLCLHDSVKPINRCFRALLVLGTAFVSYSIPDFGKFLGLVGSSICTLLGFIIPCYFHLSVFERKELSVWELTLDVALILFGVVFGSAETYKTFKELFLARDQ